MNLTVGSDLARKDNTEESVLFFKRKQHDYSKLP